MKLEKNITKDNVERPKESIFDLHEVATHINLKNIKEASKALIQIPNGGVSGFKQVVQTRINTDTGKYKDFIDRFAGKAGN